MAETKLGKIAMTPKGAWDASTVYEKLDVVRHNGGSWLSKQANTNVEPVEGEYWTAVTEKQLDDSVVEKSTAWSSKNIIDRLCPEVTANGNPAVLEDIVEGYPMDITASWDIQQEGEGEPHLEGYGKNLLDITKCSTTSSAYGVTPSISGDMVVLTGTANGIGDYSFMAIVKTPDYTLSGKGYVVTAFPTKGTIPQIYGLRTETENAITIRLPTYADGDVVDIRFRIMVSVDTPTEYESYAANIRPFVGRDSVTVNRYGKNLLDVPSVWEITGCAYFKFSIRKGTYCISSNKATLGGNAYPFFSIDEPEGVYLDGAPHTITLTKDVRHVYVYSNGHDYRGSQGITSTIYDFMITAVPDAGDYEPYTAPTTATLALPETVYGGSVGNDGKGKKTHLLQVFSGASTVNNQNGEYDNDDSVMFSLVLPSKETGIQNRKIYCNICPALPPGESGQTILATAYAIGAHSEAKYSRHLYLRLKRWMIGVEDTSSTSVEKEEKCKAWLQAQSDAGHPLTVAYQTTAPVTFTTTPATVFALPTNTIITDADTITATARKDPIKTITNLTDRVAALEAAATNIEEV